MKACLTAVLAGLLVLAATPAWSQSSDAAAERARIANERIQAEAERQAAEAAAQAQQAERLAAAEEARAQRAEAMQTAPAAAARPAPDRPPAPPAPLKDAAASRAAMPEASRADMSRVMQQIRTLGELRDAGYVTEEEFERIKKRLLDGEL